MLLQRLHMQRIVRARRTARNVPDAVKTKNAASAGIAGTKDIAVTTTITARTEGITTAEEAVAEAVLIPFRHDRPS